MDLLASEAAENINTVIRDFRQAEEKVKQLREDLEVLKAAKAESEQKRLNERAFGGLP